MGRLPGKDYDLSCLHCDAAVPLPARCGCPATLHQAAYTTVETSVTKAAATSQERKQAGETMVRKESDYDITSNEFGLLFSPTLVKIWVKVGRLKWLFLLRFGGNKCCSQCTTNYCISFFINLEPNMYSYICVNKSIIREAICRKRRIGLKLISPFCVEATLDVLWIQYV